MRGKIKCFLVVPKGNPTSLRINVLFTGTKLLGEETAML